MFLFQMGNRESDLDNFYHDFSKEKSNKSIIIIIHILNYIFFIYYIIIDYYRYIMLLSIMSAIKVKINEVLISLI